MAHSHDILELARTENALTILFCLVDDAYQTLNSKRRRYESLKRLSDSQVLALALFQYLRGVESERSFLPDAARFFGHLFPGGGRAGSLLVPPPSARATVLPGAPKTRHPARARGRSGDLDRGLDAA